MVPPVQVGAPGLQLPPLPVTVKPPPLPVAFRMMPLVGPLAPVPALMLRNVNPLAPIVVVATFNAVPVVVVNVFAPPITLTVPPPVAVNALFVLVLSVTPPLKLIVAPVFEFRKMPVPVPVTGPAKVTVPPVLLTTLTCRPPEFWIVPE